MRERECEREKARERERQKKKARKRERGRDRARERACERARERARERERERDAGEGEEGQDDAAADEMTAWPTQEPVRGLRGQRNLRAQEAKESV